MSEEKIQSTVSAMKTMQVIVDSDNISSPLGDTTSANMAALQRGESGVRLHRDTTRCADDFFAALFPENAQVFENAPGSRLHEI
jgi:hypothetical protein